MKPNIWDKLDSIGSLEAKSSKLFEFLEKNKPIPADKFLSSAPSFSYRYLLGELVRDHSQNLLGHGEGWSLHKPIAGELADRVNGFLGGLGTAPRATKTFDEVFLALLTPLVQNREFLVVRKINSSLASFELGQLEFQREYMEGALSVAYILTVHPPLNNRERVLHLLNHKAFELRRASDFFLDLCKSVPNLNFIQDPAKSFFDSKRRLTATQAYPPQSNRDRVLIYSLKALDQGMILWIRQKLYWRPVPII